MKCFAIALAVSAVSVTAQHLFPSETHESDFDHLNAVEADNQFGYQAQPGQSPTYYMPSYNQPRIQAQSQFQQQIAGGNVPMTMSH